MKNDRPGTTRDQAGEGVLRDADDRLRVAMLDAWKVARFTPAGRLDTPHVTPISVAGNFDAKGAEGRGLSW